MKLTLERAAEFMPATGDFDREAVANGYSIDSRTVQPGDLFFAVHGERPADPKWIGEMVPARIGRIGVNQNAQAAVVQHQPGHQFGKHLGRKGDLIHGLIVRPNLDVMPAPKRDREALVHPCTQLLGLGPACRRIVVDMSVKACDFGDRPWGNSPCIRHVRIPSRFHPSARQTRRRAVATHSGMH